MAIFGWEQSLGWLAFLSLIPFILLYLVRPKAREIEVPSLMFFMKSKTHHARQSFFQRLVKNWLFLLQLFILLLLCFFLIEPYTSLGGNVLTENAILIVDASASTQAHNDVVFEEIITEARESLGKVNTIILVSNTPRTVLKKATKREAERYLKRLKPTDTRSSIGDAITFAEKHITGEKDKLVVISDFLTTSTVGVQAAKNSLTDKGISVTLKPVGVERVNNVGIIGLEITKEKSVLSVKNYNNEAQKVTYLVGGEEGSLVIDARSIETATFKTPEKPTTIKLQEKDDFLPDNEAYVTLPKLKKVRVLLLSDTPSRYLPTAIRAAENIHLDVTGSSSFVDGYDVYVVGAVRELRKSMVTKLEEAVENGKSVVIHAQQTSPELNYRSLLPLELGGVRGESIVTVSHLTKFTKDVTFGSVGRHYATTKVKGIPLATAEDNVVVALATKGKGNLVYYGILEDKSEFKFSPSYPIFWTNLIKYLAQAPDIEDVNVRTGSILALPTEMKVKTPTKVLTTDIIIFEEKGIYSFEDQVYTASLLSELESDLNAKTSLEKTTDGKGVVTDLNYPLAVPLLLLLLVLFFVEILTTKGRGEL